MSIRPVDDATIAAYRHGVSPSPPDGSRQGEVSFREAFGRLMATGAPATRNGRQAAGTAELIGLEMMRSSLALDAPSSASTGSAAARDLVMALYDAESQNIGSVSRDGSGGGDRVTGGPGPAESAPADGGAACPRGIDTLIGRASRRYGVDAGLIKAVVHAESNFKPTAVSPAGAQGLMQLMPSTAAGLGVTEPFDPEQNVMAGTRFLKDLLNRYGGDLDKTLAAYNWGPGNLSRGNGHLPRETRDYLVKVKRLYENYREA